MHVSARLCSQIYRDFNVPAVEVPRRVLIISALNLDRNEVHLREGCDLLCETGGHGLGTNFASRLPTGLPASVGSSAAATAAVEADCEAVAPVVLLLPNPRSDPDFMAVSY